MEDTYRWQNANIHAAGLKQVFLFQIKLRLHQLLGRRLFYVLRYRYSALDYLLSHQNELRSLYSWLNDEYSKSLLIGVLVRKVLGTRQLQTLVDEDIERRRFDEAERLITELETDAILMGTTEFLLNRYNLMDIGYQVDAYIHSMNVVWTYMSEQYRYKHGDIDIGIMPEDVAIDAGGCWGDTALYMASKGAQKVYSFEVLDDNLVILNRNLAANPSLRDRITIVKKGVWSEDETVLSFFSNGPATQLMTGDENENSIQTITLDTFVERENINRVDFIKMDIEGSELSALIGAKRTIQQFAPRIAIAVYHKVEDLATIPQFLKSVQPDYEFYLDHFTTTMMETILFAVPGSYKYSDCCENSTLRQE